MCEYSSEKSHFRNGLVFSLALFLSVAGEHASESQPHFQNFQHLVCNHWADSGELSLALLSLSESTDPAHHPELKGKLAIQFEVNGDRAEIVSQQNLRTAVLGDFRSELDRKYQLFAFDLVIDESSSISAEHLMQARNVINEFLQRIPVVYEAQIVRFSSQVAPPSAFGNDPATLRRALMEPRLTGGTSFYSALERAARELAANEKPLRFIVAFTDGADTSGRDFESFQRSFQQLMEAEQIFLFIAGIGGDDGIRHDQLKSLPGTMGLYVRLDQVPDVKQLFDQVERMLEKTYILRIPTLSTHKGSKKLYVMRQRDYKDSYETLQDIHLPPRCVPP